MRAYALALATASLLALSGAALSQGIQIGPEGVQVLPHRQGRSVGKQDCDELRRACLYKEELGEQGEGNCRQYRRLCRGR